MSMAALALIAWLVSAVVGSIIGLPVGKPGKGALLGFLFGPLGWALMIIDADAKIITGVAAALLAGVGLYIAILMSEARERRIENEARIERQKAEDMWRRYASAAPTPKPVPASISWSAFPPGVDTPKQRREYLQRKVEEKRKRQARD